MLFQYRHIIALSAILMVSACSVPIIQKDGAELLYSANEEIVKNNHDMARQYYVDALSSVRRDIRAEAYYEISKIDRENGDHESYIRNLENAVALQPEKYELRLARAYHRYGNPSQIEKAKDIFLKYNDINADANLALMDITNDIQYLEKSRQILKSKLAFDGDGKDQLQLARTYYMPNGISPDFKKAEYYYRQSIATGNTDAAYELAKMWTDNNLRDNANDDAFSLILKAANLGQQKSIKYVAKSYADNNDDVKATYWYQQLADKYNERVAYDYLAPVSLKNTQSNQDTIPPISMDAYQNAARQGSNKGDLALAIWDNQPDRIKGISDKDVLKQARALKSLFGNRQPKLERDLNQFLSKNNIAEPQKTSSKSNDNPFAKQLQSAQSLMVKAADPQSVQQAFDIYKKIAEAGSVEGQYQTGIMYARGMGVEKDMVQAKEWLNRASENGYPLAIETLQSLSSE